MQVAEDNPVGDEDSAKLDIMQPAPYAHVAALTTAYPASSHRSAYRPRGVFHMKSAIATCSGSLRAR